MMQQLIRNARDHVPLKVKLRLLYHANNALSVLPGSDRVPLTAQQLGDFWLIHERGSKRPALAVTAFERWVRYDHGIDYQLNRLARQYGVGRDFEINPGDRVVDVGANIGEFSLYAHHHGASLLSIEADRTTARLLHINVGQLPDIKIMVCPVWEEDKVVDFYSSPEDAESSLIPPLAPVDRVGKRQAYRLDTLTAEWAPDAPIKLIKCDAEGAEPEVLRGASDTLARTEWIAFDVGPERDLNETFDECLSIVSDHGFKMVGQRRTGPQRRILVARRA